MRGAGARLDRRARLCRRRRAPATGRRDAFLRGALDLELERARIMPEGPSIVILKDEAKRLVGQRIVAVEGNTRIEKERLVGQRIVALRSWGKHFLIELPTFALRVHFMMFGSYRIDARKEAEPRLGLRFAPGGELNVYTCSVR